jgi:hypothetical protein
LEARRLLQRNTPRTALNATTATAIIANTQGGREEPDGGLGGEMSVDLVVDVADAVVVVDVAGGM